MVLAILDRRVDNGFKLSSKTC